MPDAYQELLQEVVPRPIASDRAYRRALSHIEYLMRSAMIELLATLIEQYEIRQGHTAPVLSPRDRLAGLIEEGGLTQTELSKQSQVPRTTLNEILHRKRSISKTNAARLAKFFGVGIGEFVAGERP